MLKKQISVAGKKEKADLVIKNGKIIDVFNGEIITGDLAIVDGMIVGIGNYEGKKTLDAKSRYVCPGLIDAHVHIESSIVTPAEYARVVVPHGVTTVLTDPHEIANVLGKKGIQFILDASENLPLEVRVMLPSSVPASAYDAPGAILKAEDLKEFFTHPRVHGLAEVMDFSAVKNLADDMLDKLTLAHEHTIHIDGHAAGLTEEDINIYRAAGIRTDHENTGAETALEQLRRGMYVIMREGSAAKDLLQLLPAVTEKNSRRFLFCSDDKQVDELLLEGSIDYHIRLSIQYGMDPITAIQIASLNAAECYGLINKGAIAPGYEADFLLLDELEAFKVSQVYKKGQLVAENGLYIVEEKEFIIPADTMNTVHMKEIKKSDLSIEMGEASQAHIIEVIPNSLYTNKLIAEVDVVDGFFEPSLEKDQLKIATIERHHATGEVGVGIIHGFQLGGGALAATFAHDSHHIVVIGTNDDDMMKAVQHLREIGGGMVVVKDEEVIADLQCPIAGLISLEKAEVVSEKLSNINGALQEIGVSEKIAPFQLMSFLCLPVIPELKLTCHGLFDFASTNYLDVRVK